MSDLFGYAPTAPQLSDIRNQRESVAHEKARLCMELNALCRRTPRADRIASIQQTRAFQAAHKTALKTLKSKDSSRTQLQSAIEQMRAYL